MAQPDVKVDMRDWERVLKGMHKADNNLRKQFRSDLRKKMNTVKNAQRAEIRSRPHVPREIVNVLASGLSIEVRERTSKSKTYGKSFSDARIRFRSSKLYNLAEIDSKTWPRVDSVRGMGKRTNKGEWRHPVFPNNQPRDQWEWDDQTTPPGWFDKPFNDRRPEIVGFINDTLKQWKAKFGFRGFGF